MISLYIDIFYVYYEKYDNAKISNFYGFSNELLNNSSFILLTIIV